MKKAKQFIVILMTGIMIFTGTSLGGFGTPSYATEDQDNAVVQQDESTDSTDQTDENADMEKSSETKEDSNADTGAVSDAENNVSSDAEVGNADKYQLQSEFKLSGDSKWQITAVYDEKAGIPENAELTIEEIDAKDSADYLKETAKALKWTDNDQAAYSRFLNISITSKGKNVKPSADVLLIIKSEDVEKNIDDMQVVRFDEYKSGKIVKTEEIECTVTEDKELELLTDKCEVFGFVVVEPTEENADPENTDNTENDDLELVEKTLKAGKVRLEGMMPEDAKATATDATDTKEVKSIESDNGTALAAYDITINAGGDEYQPDEDNPINVQISNKAIKEDSNLSIWHLKDDGTKEEVKDFTVEDGKVLFDTTGFSVYVVIDHENETVENPRVEFHFIDDNAENITVTGGNGNSVSYYKGSPYTFKNNKDEWQDSQILKNGESLELITDPANKVDSTDQSEQYFYGWYIVDPYNSDTELTDNYGIGKADSKMYYTWPLAPKSISFEKPITIDETNVNIDSVVHWSMNGVSGSGAVDKDGNVHVFLVPMYKDYNFVNFMLRPYGANQNQQGQEGARSLMTRKLIAKNSSGTAEVKISDIRSNSTDATHLVFIGWQYYDENQGMWIEKPTVDYTGAEIKDPGRDGVYLTINLADTKSVDLYPMFTEARWVDFVSGRSGDGASYVASRFRKAWGSAMPPGTDPDPDENVLTSMDVPTREGYVFDGWYALALTDEEGNITNLTQEKPQSINYLHRDDNNPDRNYEKITQTVNTTAIQITDETGAVTYDGAFSVDSDKLFEGNGSQLKLYESLDRLKLYAKWSSDSAKITVVYWTENAQEEGYSAPADPKDDYTASAVLNIDPAVNTSPTSTSVQLLSGNTITLADLQTFEDSTSEGNSVSVLDQSYLSEVGAVSKNEKKFYERNDTLSDASVVVKGDGSAIYNVYYSRMEFRLVFHIGRDNYVKNSGHQKTDANWDGNWIEFMYRDEKVRDLGYMDSWNQTNGRKPGNSYSGLYSMTYIVDGKTYSSAYETDEYNVMGDYIPGDDENVYVIKAKYGAFIGDRWPSPVNPNFTFTDAPGKGKTMYIWAAYYGSLYCRIANDRSTAGNEQGANPDINGVYDYMSAELCSNRAGTDIINQNKVHHLVAYYGEQSKTDRFKRYHILYEAMDGTYDPASVTPVSGTEYEDYPMTTWSAQTGNTAGDKSEIIGHSFIEPESPREVISNLQPQFQLSEALDGYDLVYSCYDPDQHQLNNEGQYYYDIYFFYKPKQYNLTFMYDNVADRKTDTYYYSQSLADAKKYADPSKVGYTFKGWYTNEAGAGDPFDFANTKMPSSNIVLYPVQEAIEYRVDIDPNGGEIDHIHYTNPPVDSHGIYATNYGLTGSGYNSSQATYFFARYETPVGEYLDLERNYIKLSRKELDPNSDVYYSETKYYYVNTHYVDERIDGDWGLSPDLRNALYMTESQISNYYNYYVAVTRANADYYTGVQELNFEQFCKEYTSYDPDSESNSVAYRPVSGERYTFMGLYQVFDDGTEASMPYNFNDPVTGHLKLRAKWRLEDGYYIQYTPTYYAEDDEGNVTNCINGDIQQWTDPADLSKQMYADQSPTNILQAPTNVTTGWVFRGWRVVRDNGTKTYTDEHGVTRSYPDWQPMETDAQGNEIFYQPGDDFIVDSSLVSEKTAVGSVIHIQAYYEPEDTSYRRPKVTNLILDANDAHGGYVNTTDSHSLPAIVGPGSTTINTTTKLHNGHPTQIMFGDIQSNLALHLFKYATTKTINNITGTNFFANDEKYLLLGFDENEDPENPTTGSAYIPAYAADAVASVTRNETNRVLYAMWEPMVYATFVNTTDEPITITLTGSTANTVSIVNEVTGEFDRQKITGSFTIPAQTVENGTVKSGRVKVVFPSAAPGDSITATATNDHLRKLMSVRGTFNGSNHGTGVEDIPYNGTVTYEGMLKTDPEGINVIYSEKPDAEVIFDVNQGVWTETDQKYEHLTDDQYSIKKRLIVNNQYKPTDPTRNGKVFIGWTTYADIAAETDFSSETTMTFGSGNDTWSITPDPGSIVLDKVRDEYLWDFSQTPPDDLTLYAVWSDAVTVTFDMTYNSASRLHTWGGPNTDSTDVPYVYYRRSDNSSSITYTLAKGDRVPKPNDPRVYESSQTQTWNFIKWLRGESDVESYKSSAKTLKDTKLVTYEFDFAQRILSNQRVITSWTTTQLQNYTFTVENRVVGGMAEEEFLYKIGVSDDWVIGKMNGATSNRYGQSDERWGTVQTTLKNNQQYTVNVIVSYITDYGGNYGIEIEVIDKDGIVVKKGQVICCYGNTNDNFASDFTYTLTVEQVTAEGFRRVYTENETHNPARDPSEGGLVYDTSNPNRAFTFTSKMGTKTGYDPGFTPNQNVYKAGEKNTMTIVFENVTPDIAPTGFNSITDPFTWLMIFGLALAAWMAYRRRRLPLLAGEEADVEETLEGLHTVRFEDFDWNNIKALKK